MPKQKLDPKGELWKPYLTGKIAGLKPITFQFSFSVLKDRVIDIYCLLHIFSHPVWLRVVPLKNGVSRKIVKGLCVTPAEA